MKAARRHIKLSFAEADSMVFVTRPSSSQSFQFYLQVALYDILREK